MTKLSYQKSIARCGLTLLEVMTAMMLSLLVLLSLASAFKMIGDRITSSQSDLDLNADIRSIVSNLRAEFDEVLVSQDPGEPSGDDGYLVYYEGPMTNETTTHVALANSNQHLQDYFQSNRFGDLDDYVAFTAKAPAGSKFIGYIPRGILAAMEVYHARVNLNQTGYNLPNYTVAAAAELVPFYATEAEIAYWLSPDWETNDGSTNPDLIGTLVYDANGHPVYRDNDGDGLPDRMNLHRRVLLIRDDLNLTVNEMRDANGDVVTSNDSDQVPVIPFLVPGNPQRIGPLSHDKYPQPQIFGVPMQEPGNWSSNIGVVEPAWLTGLARLQQVMDLSISRVNYRAWNDMPPTSPNAWDVIPPGLNDVLGNGIPMQATMTNPTSIYGSPSRLVRANNILDLHKPQNRFAHVRMPEPLLSDGSAPNAPPPYGIGSSMPLLARCPPFRYLSVNEALPRNTAELKTDRAILSQADPRFGGYGRFTMTGFVRPEFNLWDRFRLGTNGLVVAKTTRGGSDVIARDVLAFDVKVFDKEAPDFAWLGPDGVEGNATDDDFDGIGTHQAPNSRPDIVALDRDELGWPGSDDEIVQMNDLNSRAILLAPNLFPFLGNDDDEVSGRFVDLGFLRLAGHPFGGTPGISQASVTTANLFTPYAGTTAISGGGLGFPPSMQQSGRLLIRQNSQFNLVNSFYQSVYDSWTNSYLNDNFDQEGFLGTMFFQGPPIPPSPNITLQNPRPPNQQGSYSVIGAPPPWWNNDPLNPGTTPDGVWPPKVQQFVNWPNGDQWPPIWPFTQQGWPANKKTQAHGWRHTERENYGISDGRRVWNGTPTMNFRLSRGSSNTLQETIPVSYMSWSNMIPKNQSNSLGSIGGLVGGYVDRGPNPIDVRPPIEQPLRAIQIQLRLLDPATGQMRQQTIVEEFTN